MQIIIKPKGEGKTVDLIKLSAASWNYIVCHNMGECRRIVSVANKIALDIPYPISYDEYLARRYYPDAIKGFLIDNVEMLLNHISLVPVNAITITQTHP